MPTQPTSSRTATLFVSVEWFFLLLRWSFCLAAVLLAVTGALGLASYAAIYCVHLAGLCSTSTLQVVQEFLSLAGPALIMGLTGFSLMASSEEFFEDFFHLPRREDYMQAIAPEQSP